MIRANSLTVEAKDPTGIDVVIDPDGTIRWRMDEEKSRRFHLARRRIIEGRGDEHTTLGEGLGAADWLRAWYMKLACIVLTAIETQPQPRWTPAVRRAMAEVERLEEERDGLRSGG